MKKIYGIFGIIFCFLFLFPMVAEAKTMVLNKEYTAKYDEWDSVSYTLKIAEAGKYKITISFDECYDDDDETFVYDYDLKTNFIVSSKKNTYECEVPFGKEKSFIVGLDKGKIYIERDSLEDLEPYYKICTIKVEKYSTKKFSFSQAHRFVKKNKKSGMKINKKNSTIRIASKGFKYSDNHEHDGYAMVYGFGPYIDIVKQGNSSYATYNLFNVMIILSIPYINDSNLTEIAIYNKKNKIVYKLDSCKETNKYDYVDYLYKDTSRCECVLFTSYTNYINDVNKLINIIKANGSKMKIRGEGSNAAYYKIQFDKKSKKVMLDSLRLYKKLLKQYK